MGNCSSFLPETEPIANLQIPGQTVVFLEHLLYAGPFSEDLVPSPVHTQSYPHSMEEETEARKLK